MHLIDNFYNGEDIEYNIYPADNQDNFFGKKARARRKAKKAAKKAAKEAGLSKRAQRLAGRAAKKQVKAKQKAKSGNYRAAARISGRGTQLSTKSKLLGTRGGLLKKSQRMQAREAGQKTQAASLRTAVATGRVTGKKAKRFSRKSERVEARKGKTALRRGIEKGAFAPILPFKKAMVQSLKDNGVSVKLGDPIDKVANLFYNNIIKKNNYEAQHFDYDLYNSADTDNVVGTALNVIIDAIIGFFAASKQKKEQGAPMSKTEEKAAEAAEKVEKTVNKKVEEEKASTIGETIMENIDTILIGIVIFAIIMVLAGRGAK